MWGGSVGYARFNHEFAMVGACTCVLLPGVGGSVGYARVNHDSIESSLPCVTACVHKNLLYTHMSKVSYTMGTSMNARRSYLIRITSTVTSKHLHVYTCQITHL